MLHHFYRGFLHIHWCFDSCFQCIQVCIDKCMNWYHQGFRTHCPPCWQGFPAHSLMLVLTDVSIVSRFTLTGKGTNVICTGTSVHTWVCYAFIDVGFTVISNGSDNASDRRKNRRRPRTFLHANMDYSGIHRCSSGSFPHCNLVDRDSGMSKSCPYMFRHDYRDLGNIYLKWSFMFHEKFKISTAER